MNKNKNKEKNKVGWEDRLWLRRNRKPTGKKEFYAGFVIGWMFIGNLIALSIFMISIGLIPELAARTSAPGLSYWAIASIIILYTAVITISFTKKDWGKGYASALYENYQRNWQERTARITEQIKKEVS